MKRVLIASLFIATATMALAEAPKELAPIVVTGRSLNETERALQECIKRKCPPDEDVKLTLAHAENQFVSGDAKAARGTLVKSIGRNGGDAKQYPVPVADLYRANGRIAANLGEGESYQSSILNSRRALKSGLANDDARILVADIEVGDMRARLGYYDEALKIYDDVKVKATAKGLRGLAVAADMRSASLQIKSEDPDQRAKGKMRLHTMAQAPGKEMRNVRLAARIILARTAKTKEEGDAATAALLDEYRNGGGATRPTLVFAPPIKISELNAEQNKGRNTLTNLQMDDVENNWVDIGFWVTADGKTSEVEIIRQSKKTSFWTKPVIKSIETRNYAPMDLPAGDPGFYMVERFTLTANWESHTGTRMRQRSPILRIERVDLTDDQTTASAK